MYSALVVGEVKTEPMKITYYPESDILFIEFNSASIGRSANVGTWANMTFAEDGTPRSLEILNAAARGITIDDIHVETVPEETETKVSPLTEAELLEGRKARAARIHASPTQAQKQK
jgi:uncharacterized protein YuzE